MVNTIHNNQDYILQFIASAGNFDSPNLTEIRQYMFNSIKLIPYSNSRGQGQPTSQHDFLSILLTEGTTSTTTMSDYLIVVIYFMKVVKPIV